MRKREIDKSENEMELVTKEEFLVIVRSTIRGLAASGLKPKQITQKIAFPIASQFLKDLVSARVTEGIMELLATGDMVITGIQDGEVIFEPSGRMSDEMPKIVNAKSKAPSAGANGA